MSKRNIKKPVCLIIMDGWGISERKRGNAIYQALTSNMDYYSRFYPNTKLNASGTMVGLPEGQMGNSEVGHLNIGAGRIVLQDYTKITAAINNGDFFKNKVFLKAFENVKKNSSTLHFMGCLSDGGVHSHIDHLKALVRMAAENGIKQFYIHAFLDGRDVFPMSARNYINDIEGLLKDIGAGEIATLSGRYYSLDRDNKWDRTKKTYDLLVKGVGEKFNDSTEAINYFYDKGVSDEFIEPCSIKVKNDQDSKIKDKDSVIFFNFRPDRTRQLTSAFISKDFNYFDRAGGVPKTFFVCMTNYDDRFDAPVAFPQERVKNTLGEVLSKNGLRQLRISETDKYPHVSFFFNGGIEEPFKNEDRILIPTASVKTYDLRPQMSAYEVTEKVIEKINEDIYDFIVLNFANADMVGHSGYMDSAITAVEAVDSCVGLIVNALIYVGGLALITADHGNAEEMICSITKNIVTAHTTSQVPFIICDENYGKIRTDYENLKLGDIAPTILEIFGIKKPVEMTGNSLLSI
ncbi:2,3-bisphosphoglycerate-independent phosphoglycerate mutase [bacterium]|nr:2,3-bisphosphoglycerate-independent phosphoglycerate mutase [bacterium]